MSLIFKGGIKLKEGEIAVSITPIPPPLYMANAVHFDGTNDWLSRGAGLTGAVDGKQGTISCWVKRNVNGTLTVLTQGKHATQGNINAVFLTSLNKLSVTFQTVSATTVWTGVSTHTILVADGWVHMIASVDSATGTRAMYINDILETLETNSFTPNAVIDWTLIDQGVGANSVGSLKLNGDMADLWVGNVYIDLPIEVNRRKFISAIGKPVNLGTNGEIPTGTSPLMFFSGETASWETNKGTGGGFIENGALTTASSSPSD